MLQVFIISMRHMAVVAVRVEGVNNDNLGEIVYYESAPYNSGSMTYLVEKPAILTHKIAT